MPAQLPSGSYRVVTRLTESTGRSVQRFYTLELKRKDGQQSTSTFARLPRFAPASEEIVLRTTATEIVATQERVPNGENDVVIHQHKFPVKDGELRVRLDKPGWYTLTAGDHRAEFFIYGGKEPPYFTRTKPRERHAPEVPRDEVVQPHYNAQEPRWIDLSNTRDDEWPDTQVESRSHAILLALPDRHDAQVGGTLRVLVYVPFDKARLVFTCEGWSIRDYHMATVDGTKGRYHVIELPIRSRHLPHFYLGGHVVHGNGVDERELRDWPLREEMKRIKNADSEGTDPRWRRIDVSDPNLRPNQEKLSVEIKTDREQYRPGDQVNVALRAMTIDGKPAEAELSLAVVDESIFSFGEDRCTTLASQFADPHPPERFHAKSWRTAVGRRWKILTDRFDGDAQRLMKAQQQMERVQDAAKALQELNKSLELSREERYAPAFFDGVMPVANIPLARLRTDFRETAVWLPQLRTDANGKAVAQFTLPDSLTRYRLTTVALDKQSNVGTARVSITAKLPLGAQIILPRFAVEKDRFFAFGMIHNQTERDQDIAIEWHLDGIAIAKLDEGFTQQGARIRGKVRIAAGKSERIAIELKAERTATHASN